MATTSHSTIQRQLWAPRLQQALFWVLETQQGGNRKHYFQEPEVLPVGENNKQTKYLKERGIVLTGPSEGIS